MGSRETATQTTKKKKLSARYRQPTSPTPVVSSGSRESAVPRITIHSSSLLNSENDENIIYHCSFEIFGIVQGVSFRMYTLRKAQKLGVRGWCKNTQDDTMKGEIEGYFRPFDTMRLWLQYTGSPTSRIDKCIFGEVKQLKNFTYKDFTIRID